MNIKAVGINARYTHSCLALFYLRNEVEKHCPDITVDICQYTINDPYYVLIQRLSEGNPDYFFFSSAIWNSELISGLITDLLLINESYRFVIGGPQAEIIGALFTKSGRVTTYQGSIEGADISFFTDLRAGSLKRSYNTSFFKTQKMEFDYPYRPEDFSGPLRNRHIYYESSRGCPFSCTYCLSSTEKGLYHKPLDQAFAELSDILKFKPSVVRFIDRTFNDIPDRALKIWNYLKEHGGDTLFHFEIAPDRFTDEMFDLLKEVEPHQFQFEIGIQSTNSVTLEAIKRTINPKSAARTIQKIRKMENIHIHADLILGLPFDTEETFYRSLNDIFAMQPHYIQMGLLKLLPGTLIDTEADQNGYRASRCPPYSVFSNNWLTADRLRELYWLCECVEKFVNNRYFITIWRYLLTIGEEVSPFFLSLARRVFDDGYFWKAATQETLSTLLLTHTKRRPDFSLIKELLCYDWLRCGHRFLPDHLLEEALVIDQLRRELFYQLPEALDDCYDKSTRTHFFKKSVFYRFSSDSLNHIGYEVTTALGTLRFSPEREKNVLRLQVVQLIAGEAGNKYDQS